ncbi:hypothetical protein FRC08_009340 [Ceratobasidium sp. 394]|nr:hypothetical protein FRC08_009340 [Ceratobasidium sp. 394]
MPVLSKPVVEHNVYDVDENEFAVQEAGRGQADRPQKCGRADSSPLSECFWVVVNCKATPFEPSSPRDSTPAESEPTLATPSKPDMSSQVGEESEAGSAEVECDCR